MIHVPTNRTATHPGEPLLGQITEMGLSVHRVARDTDLPASRLHEIVHGRRGVSAETAIAPGAYFGQTPAFRMAARMAYDLSKELVDNGEVIRSRVRRYASEHSATGPGATAFPGTPVSIGAARKEASRRTAHRDAHGCSARDTRHAS